jgi:hypothetical protein
VDAKLLQYSAITLWLTDGEVIGNHPVGRSVSEGEHVSETLWVRAVIHDGVPLRHLHLTKVATLQR